MWNRDLHSLRLQTSFTDVTLIPVFRALVSTAGCIYKATDSCLSAYNNQPLPAHHMEAKTCKFVQASQRFSILTGTKTKTRQRHSKVSGMGTHKKEKLQYKASSQCQTTNWETSTKKTSTCTVPDWIGRRHLCIQIQTSPEITCPSLRAAPVKFTMKTTTVNESKRRVTVTTGHLSSRRYHPDPVKGILRRRRRRPPHHGFASTQASLNTRLAPKEHEGRDKTRRVKADVDTTTSSIGKDGSGAPFDKWLTFFSRFYVRIFHVKIILDCGCLLGVGYFFLPWIADVC